MRKKSTKRKFLGKGSYRLGEVCAKGGFLRYKTVGQMSDDSTDDFGMRLICTVVMAYIVGMDLGCGSDRLPPKKRRRTRYRSPPRLPPRGGSAKRWRSLRYIPFFACHIATDLSFVSHSPSVSHSLDSSLPEGAFDGANMVGIHGDGRSRTQKQSPTTQHMASHNDTAYHRPR